MTRALLGRLPFALLAAAIACCHATNEATLEADGPNVTLTAQGTATIKAAGGTFIWDDSMQAIVDVLAELKDAKTRIAALETQVTELRTSQCGSGDVLRGFVAGVAQCVPDKGSSGSCDEGHVVASIDAATGVVQCTSYEVQQRVAGGCSDGESIKTVHADGKVDCHVDVDTLPSDTEWQKRIENTCTAEQSIREVLQTGAVVCEDDDQPNEDDWQRRVEDDCPSGESIRSIAANGTVACEVDNDTPPTQEEWQGRVTGSCPAGTAIRQISSNGAVTCDPPLSHADVEDKDTVFTVWGKKDCPPNTGLVYSGWMAGPATGQSGNGPNQQCMPIGPEYSGSETFSNNNFGLIYPMEYVTDGYGLDVEVESQHWRDLHGRLAACAVCSAEADDVIMVPAKLSCPSSEYELLYTGWIMSTSHSAKSASSSSTVATQSHFLCVHELADSLTNDRPNLEDSARLYPTEIQEPHPSFPGYVKDREASCSVCGLKIRGDDKAQTVFTTWGRSSCPSVAGVSLVYSGWAASGKFDHAGGGDSTLCMPPNPEYVSGLGTPSNENGGLIYDTEYEIQGENTAINGVDNKPAPCAVCVAEASDTLMVPGRAQCPTGTVENYKGWIMANRYSEPHSNEFVCVDQAPETIAGNKGTDNGNLWFPTEYHGVDFSIFGAYTKFREISCASCSIPQTAEGTRVTSFPAWGRRNCPDLPGVEELWSGWIGNGHYNHAGSGHNNLCMHPEPIYLSGFTDTNSQEVARIYHTEYQTAHDGSPLLHNRQDMEAACAMCTVPAADVITIPARLNCPIGTTLLYNGLLMTNKYDHAHVQEYSCVDKRAEPVVDTDHGNQNGALLYPVETELRTSTNSGYADEIVGYGHDLEVTCVVCATDY